MNQKFRYGIPASPLPEMLYFELLVELWMGTFMSRPVYSLPSHNQIVMRLQYE